MHSDYPLLLIKILTLNVVFSSVLIGSPYSGYQHIFRVTLHGNALRQLCGVKKNSIYETVRDHHLILKTNDRTRMVTYVSYLKISLCRQ